MDHLRHNPLSNLNSTVEIPLPKTEVVAIITHSIIYFRQNVGKLIFFHNSFQILLVHKTISFFYILH